MERRLRSKIGNGRNGKIKNRAKKRERSRFGTEGQSLQRRGIRYRAEDLEDEETRSRIRGRRGSRKSRIVVVCKIYAFVAVLGFLAFVALIIPLRPKESQIEKRTLTKFPKPTVETLWNGEFFEGVNTWYADTFPFREKLISGNMGIRAAYGVQKNQIYGDVQAVAQVSEEDIAEEETKENEQEKTTVKSGEKQREIQEIQEKFGAVYVAENTAFGLYGFNQKGVDKYVEAVNTLANKVDEEVNIYDMIVPISSGVYLDAELQKELGSSDQREAIQYICDKLDKKVTPIDVFATLEDHNDEYLYFRTDHHWTALGAYYAYCEFMKEKDIKPTPIDSYETKTFDNFLGTMYSYCNQSAALGETPDTVTAYIPLATNDMTYTDRKGNTVEYEIISDVSEWNAASKYNCFIGGDQPISEIHNPTKNDGSSCLVVKESFGNAFVPFLVDHYEYVYVVDYRYYPSGLTALISEKEIKDVLFLNNISAASADKLVANIAEIVNY